MRVLWVQSLKGRLNPFAAKRVRVLLMPLGASLNPFAAKRGRALLMQFRFRGVFGGRVSMLVMATRNRIQRTEFILFIFFINFFLIIFSMNNIVIEICLSSACEITNITRKYAHIGS